VGGVHPKLDIYFFGTLLEQIRQHRPDLHIKAFTAVELDYMFRKAKMSTAEGVRFLKEKGLNSIPGGGAEIFADEIRSSICADKCSAERWLEIHEAVHMEGMRSNCTLLYGHIETYVHRVDHLDRLRKLQDKTKGFQTFIPLKFRNKDNDMAEVQEATLIEDLKMYAVSRIFLDNFDHVKAYWPMIGRSTAQLAQSFGVDDLDGTIDDSTRIYSMAGAEEQTPVLTTEQLADLIYQAGRIPVERDTLYNVVKTYEAVPTN
jgi:aminodeoxyfutalosine synthase